MAFISAQEESQMTETATNRLVAKAKLASIGVVLAAMLAVAAPAHATTELSSYPTFFYGAVSCIGANTIIIPLDADSANLYPNFQESQRVFVQFFLYNSTNGASFADPNYYYGTAINYDTWNSAMDHVQYWYYSGNPGVALPHNANPFTYNVHSSGTWTVAVRYAWNQSSSGAKASSWGIWHPVPGSCTF
jgi:hypothetical protein